MTCTDQSRLRAGCGPSAFRASVACDHLEHVKRVGGLSAHPLGVGLVVDQGRGVVSAGCQALGLRLGFGVQKAEGVAIELARRRCCDHLDGGYGVAAQEQMPIVRLKSNRTLDAQLDRLLPPGEIPDQ